MRMRAGLAALGTAMLLSAGGALAQAPETGATPAPAPQAQAPAPAPPAPAAAPAEQPAPTANAKYRSKDGDLRAAALIGTTVYNDQKQTIGTISDLLVDKDSKVAKAVLSVGGFLGVGSRLVAVPFADLRIEPDRVVLPGATKVSLENLSAFQAGG
ncbi:MAG TPA: PRC-barrel domain-containing protein [Acetobacteraceae bacterium]|nr:PRC-barrel domain-containing protein [Acetobacteraceae bacterium]